MPDRPGRRAAHRPALMLAATSAVLAALLVLSPLAAASPAPVASGTAKLLLGSPLAKALRKSHVKLLGNAAATVAGTTLTLPVASGSVDPASGLGTIDLGGGFTFRVGKRKAPVGALTLDSAGGSLDASVAGKAMKLAAVTGATATRAGFGVSLSVGTLKLTAPAAKRLDRKLGFAKTARRAQKTHRAAASAAKGAGTPSGPFRAGQSLGSAQAETQPSSLALLPQGTETLTVSKEGLEVPMIQIVASLEALAPTTVAQKGPPASFSSLLSGGTVAPNATAGIVQAGGGIAIKQLVGRQFTVLKLSGFAFDLAAKTVSAEVTVTSEVPQVPTGALGRITLLDASLVGATVESNPLTHTVAISGATLTLSPAGAALFNQDLVKPAEESSGVPEAPFIPTQAFGTLSFAAQTQ